MQMKSQAAVAFICAGKLPTRPQMAGKRARGVKAAFDRVQLAIRPVEPGARAAKADAMRATRLPLSVLASHDIKYCEPKQLSPPLHSQATTVCTVQCSVRTRTKGRIQMSRHSHHKNVFELVPYDPVGRIFLSIVHLVL
jgi:hypothetical protein